MPSCKVLPTAWGIALVAACLAMAAEQPAEKAGKDAAKEQRSQFLRIARDKEDNPLAMQASIVRCVPSDSRRRGVAVDLVSAVHIAEKAYYDQLNREFAGYDAVLYELVAPSGTRVPKGGAGRSDSPVSFLQNAMKTMLELEFQLDAVDYQAENLVHADMSPDEFAESMQQRGESMLGIFARMMGYAIARQQGSGKASDAQLLMALFDKSRARALKQVLAEQFEDMEGSLLALNGSDGSTIISERNKVALDVLRKQLAAGKKKIAIFYGAGHMPDMLQRLRDDFAMKPTRTRWLNAWNLAAEE